MQYIGSTSNLVHQNVVICDSLTLLDFVFNVIDSIIRVEIPFDAIVFEELGNKYTNTHTHPIASEEGS